MIDQTFGVFDDPPTEHQVRCFARNWKIGFLFSLEGWEYLAAMDRAFIITMLRVNHKHLKHRILICDQNDLNAIIHKEFYTEKPFKF